MGGGWGRPAGGVGERGGGGRPPPQPLSRFCPLPARGLPCRPSLFQGRRKRAFALGAESGRGAGGKPSLVCGLVWGLLFVEAVLSFCT